jgi:predicted transcriptional regulator of viral defense system
MHFQWKISVTCVIYTFNLIIRDFTNMQHIENFIKSLRARGKRCFTTDEAQATLGIARNAVNNALYRLNKKGDVVSPARNLYLIVPPEYQILGCLPPDHFIPLLMEHWKIPYYVGLLSAAAYHGAAHQQPQVFQVITEKQYRSIHCGNVRVQFIKKKDLGNGITQKITVPTGYLTISTPEMTAMDMLAYTQQSGGLNHIATILTELVDVIDGTKLLKLAKQSPTIAWVQRLGYLLEVIEPENLEQRNMIVALLRNYVREKKPQTGFPRHPDWNVAINTEVESDI